MWCLLSQIEIVRGSKLLEKIGEDTSLDTFIQDLLSQTKDTEESSQLRDQPDHSLFLAIANAQRATLQDERERLRL